MPHCELRHGVRERVEECRSRSGQGSVGIAKPASEGAGDSFEDALDGRITAKELQLAAERLEQRLGKPSDRLDNHCRLATGEVCDEPHGERPGGHTTVWTSC